MDGLASERFRWAHLNRLQLGKYAEYFANMEFLMLGCDVFTSEVDDHGIDFVVRTLDGRHYDIQVKSYLRGSYVALDRVDQSFLLALVRFVNGEHPVLFLVPSAFGRERNPLFREAFTR